MKQFKNIEEVDEWVAPMSYLEFWTAIAPYNLILQDRWHCDDQIRSGECTEEIVLKVLKHMARMELTQIQGLKRRLSTPWVRLVVSH